jgi:DNA-binding beta-propeller fold protein YncE
MPNPSGIPFEEKVRAAVDVPAPRDEFIQNLWTRIALGSDGTPVRGARRRQLSFAWIGLAIVFAALMITTLIIGPMRVYAAIRGLLGYIPGVGIVDQSAPIRVLAKPVSQTREGITITVTSATLSSDSTHVEYRIFGVPRSAYPNSEDVHGCFGSDYLLLPDGTKLERMQDFPPVPADVPHALLVIPCIGETLAGTVPENWALPLRFVPAPADLTVMPVLELSPSPEVTSELLTTPGASLAAPVMFDQVIETADGYILLGRFQPSVGQSEWAQVTGMPLMHDATGARVSYTIPNDIQPPEVNDGLGGYGFAFQFKAASLTYPLSITFPGVVIGPADPAASAQIEFDAGSDPQPGREWPLNQRIELAGHAVTLVSISTDARNGYAFKFDSGAEVYSVSVDIEGHPANGGGGGGEMGVTGGTFYTSLDYIEVPTGKLTVDVSNLVLVKDRLAWEGQWSPSAPRTDLVGVTPQLGLCLTANDIAGLPLAPADFVGRALVYEPLAGSESWGMVLYDLASGAKRVLVADAARGALSPDGTQLAFPAQEGFHILNLDTAAEKVIELASGGYDLHWSPDGMQIAFVGSSAEGIYIARTDGSGEKRVSDAAYSSVIGFSPDGARLYLAVMYTGGSAWMVRVVDLASGTAQDLTTIENGSMKMLAAVLSPDEEWIAYRGRDNDSLYVMHPDGSAMHKVMEQPALAMSGVQWSASGWLGVSLVNGGDEQRTLLIVKPESCQAYLLRAQGDLEGLWVR